MFEYSNGFKEGHVLGAGKKMEAHALKYSSNY